MTAGTNYYLFYKILLLTFILYFSAEAGNYKIFLMVNCDEWMELFCVWPWFVLLITELVIPSCVKHLFYF